MRILIGCECSGVIRQAFRVKGHQAYSCDLQPADDNSPHHFQCNIFDIIYNGWDLMIAHPPCTFLCVSGARWLYDERYPTRQQDQNLGAKFFMDCYNAPISKICIENPIGVMSTLFRKPDQIIQPWWFGHNAVKQTCFWLKGLPPLKKKYYEVTNEKDPYFIHNLGSGHSKERSKTFLSVALAMADQWG